MKKSSLQRILESLDKKTYPKLINGKPCLSITVDSVIDSMALGISIFENSKKFKIPLEDVNQHIESGRYIITNVGYVMYWPEIEYIQ